MNASTLDAIIIGGGPAGATSAIMLARAGYQVMVLERSSFPRFHVGESFLPRNLTLIRDLGLDDKLAALPQVQKLGAEFVMGHGKDEPSYYRFETQMGHANAEAFNIERAPFDAMLLDAAEDAGAVVRQNAPVRRIDSLEHGHVTVSLDDGEQLNGRILIDASGQGTVVGRHLKIRKVLPHHQKVAYYGHFCGVKRLSGERAGYPTVVICDEGWFWLIPIDQDRTSIGLVIDAAATRSIKVPANQMLRWAIAHCPVMHERTCEAEFPETNGVTADFSYRCAPYAGSGYFLVGDAATFVDPIFSTGVCLGMMSATELPCAFDRMFKQNQNPARVQRDYIRFVERTSSVFFELVDAFYRPEFRDMFLHGQGPLRIHNAVIATFAGQVFPRLPIALRWRLALFRVLMRIHRHRAMVPRRAGFSLLNSIPVSDATPTNCIDAMDSDDGGRESEFEPVVSVMPIRKTTTHDAAHT